MTDRSNRFIEQPEDIDSMITILGDKKKPTAKPKDSTDKPSTGEGQTSDSKSKNT